MSGEDIVIFGFCGVLEYEVQVALEMGPTHGVISNTVHVTQERHLGHVQGKQGFSGVELHLVVHGNLRHVTLRPLAAALDL